MAKGDRRIHTGRYFNCNYYATAIVATVTEGADWAAYIGGADDSAPERVAVESVARTGAKLSVKDARHFFPQFKDIPYRR